ncbi:sortase family protein [Actinomycetospora succinea]|uniref:Sortase family protein n=1 Tax=Actinomycetospora succinea TaxID=663603 RepID=A0A4R6VME5_9PSEU|nr:class F sortase [Actinomycetospora succinea]TDQ63109.1 sortase family protein [Actinomycetospora succinea]
MTGRLTAFVLALLAIGVLVAVFSGSGDQTPPPPTLAPGQRESVPMPMAPADIAAIDIPAIGLSTDDTTDLGLRADNSLDVPRRASTVGWYEESASPGAVGPAVLAAHVNLRGDHGAFARIGLMAPGQTVEVHRDDDTTAVFTVDRVDQVAKDAFPTQAVYAPTPDSQIRLITCGGAFDHRAISYEDNIVVYGHLTSAYREGKAD